MSAFKLGDEVLTTWASDGFLYPAVLVEIQDEKGHVAYLDGDEADVDMGTVRLGMLGPGLAVQVNWKGKGRYYEGVIQKRCGQAVFLHYKDGSREWATVAQCRVRYDVAMSIPVTVRACCYCGGSMSHDDSRCQSCGAPRV